MTNLSLIRNQNLFALIKPAFFFVLITLHSNPSALSAPLQERVLESTRASGRGGTYVAAFDSQEATMANPAALAESDSAFQLRPLDLDVFIGENSLDTISDLTDLSADSTIVTFLQKLESKIGKHQYFRGQLMPLATRIYSFEATPFISNHSYLDMRVPSLPEATLLADTAVGMNLSLGFPLGKFFTLGATLRPTYRIYLSGYLSFAEVLDFLDDSDLEIDDILPLKTGTHLGLDLGGIYKPSDKFRLGITIENVGYASAMEDEKAPPPYEQRVNLGSLWRMGIGRWNWDLSLDVLNALNPNGVNYLRLIRVGSEFGTSYFTRDHDFGVLTGLREGWLALGLFADLWLLRLQLVNYGVELGETPGQRQDRRWAITAKTSMTF